MPHRRTQDTEPMDQILHWAVQSQGQWRSISTGLSPDRHRGWPPHPSKRSGGCSTITEEREDNWSRQHPSRIGPSRWRGCNQRSHGNLQQDLADRRLAKPMDPVLSHHTSQERQPAGISLINHPSKVMLKTILNRLKPQAEKIIAEEQAGLRVGRSTTEQIFNQPYCPKSQHKTFRLRAFSVSNTTRLKLPFNTQSQDIHSFWLSSPSDISANLFQLLLFI